jgi:ribosomal protein S18 acetylase RimI-like enzyme
MFLIKIRKNEFNTAYFKKDVYLLEILSDEQQNDEYFKKNIIITNELNSLNKYPYIICKHELSDLPTIHALESTGFQLISVDIKLKTEVNKPLEIMNGIKNEFLIERINQKYECNFVDLLNKTQRFFDSTHFYKSPYLDNLLCDYFYKGWILKNVKGRTNENYIVTYEKEIIGFIFGNKDGRNIDIDLIWVSENFRKAGIGKFLILSLIKNSRCNEITVKTQINNYPAVKLYTKIGFNVIEVFSVFHRSN